MKKNTKVIYFVEALLALYLVLFNAFILDMSVNAKNIISAVLFTIILIILVINFGISKDKGYLKGNTARIVTIILMIYLLGIYGSGIFLGFNRGFVYGDLIVFIKSTVFIVLLTIEIEFIRYLIAKNSFYNKKTIIIFTFLSVIFNVLLELNMGMFVNNEDRFIFLCKVVFPIIASEALCSFMTYKTGLLPSLIYKLTMNLYIYIFPIVPNLGDYIYNKVNKSLIRYNKEKEKFTRVNNVIFVTPVIIFFIILVILVSGITKYKLIAIASDSMKPTYSRGDAVIYKKIDPKDYKVGDILAFEKEDIVVTHRIVKIWKQGNEYTFVTKGDSNNTKDYFMPNSSSALGKVNFSIKYIGYPTVLINDFFRKE